MHLDHVPFLGIGVLLTFLAFYLISATASDLPPRALDPDAVLDPADYLTRSFHSAIVVGNYLYIDGGQIAYISEGLNNSVPENSTYSLDLSASWTNQSVRLNRIDKGSFVALNSENLWLDPSEEFIYSYNGDINGAIPIEWYFPPPTSQLLKFTPDGPSGTWELVTSVSIDRATAALNAYGNGVGYAVGGWKNSHTDQALDTSLVAPGLVACDLESYQCLNSSVPDFGGYGSLWDGVAQFLPDYGDSGLVLVMGGLTSLDPGLFGGHLDFVKFDHVSLYDIKTGTWKTQNTSGAIPPPRWRTCSVAAKGDNNTWEIFMYAGNAVLPTTTAAPNQNTGLDVVYVLSIPSFTWFKTSYTAANARFAHSCNLAADDSRQMIVLGGYQYYANIATLIPDVLTQGLGVFDITDMVWKDHYDADAATYVTPQMVKKDYVQNGRTPRTGWTDSSVQSLFVKTSSPPANNTLPSTSPNTSAPAQNGHSGGSNTGAIAGGVVGGIAAVLLVILLIWWFRRRQQRTRSPQPTQAGLFTEQSRYELDAKTRSELDGVGTKIPVQLP